MSIITNALSGSLAAQAAVTATSQNIANVQTKGYTRQGVLLGATNDNVGTRSPGSGVEVRSLVRFSDAYKSQQMWRSASELGAHNQTQPYLTQLERVMGDEASSISNGVDSFFAALNAASLDPTSTPLRQQVVSAADSMAQHFNSINAVLNNQTLSVQQQRSAIVPQANATMSTIAALNGKITAGNALGGNVSTLIDARDQAIDNLAAQMALEVTDQPDGSRNVSLRGGEPLVAGDLAGTLTSALNAAGGQDITLKFSSSTFNLNNAANMGGQMGGLGDFEKNVLVPLQQSVKDIASAMADAINTQLAAGNTMDGTAGTPLFQYGATGNTLLSVSSGYGATDLAFSSDNTPGNSDNLRQLIDIKNNTINVSSIGSAIIGDADTQLVGKLSIASQQNQALLTTADTVRNQALSDWSATSAVNKDEEAVNLLEFQNMFQANMKVITAANEMFDATLAMMR